MSSHEEFSAFDRGLSRPDTLPLPPFSGYPAFKRTCDIVGALALGILILPLVLLTALMIRRDGGSAFYFQERVGRGGQVFRFWKLRTMVPDAEAALAQYLQKNPDARAEWDLNQKLRHDPRVTSIGHFLRKHSIDELPQLWNVLRGDMSLVGPRPILVSQRRLYPGALYGNCRPGLTGLWQVTERHLSAFSERARLDRIYAEQVSLRTDLWIMILTLRPLLAGTGC